jgi:HD-GYP domain-containing protein (c-di-GMP phosphodiesterase class II)
VVLNDLPANHDESRFDAADRAKQLAPILHEEFGVPFTFFDPATGDEVGNSRAAGDAPSPAQLAELVAEGKGRVWPDKNGGYLLALPLFEADRLVLFGCGNLRAIASSGTPEAARELGRLQKWLQAVGDRLRLAIPAVDSRRDVEAGPPNAVSWEALLTLDHLIRRLRVHKQPLKNQQRILDGAFRLLRAQALIWVPQQADAPILMQGDPLLSPPESRALAGCLSQHPDYRPLEPLVCNDLAAAGWANRFPLIHNLLAFVLTDQGPVGWVIAVNKKSASGPAESKGKEEISNVSAFRKSDAALLTPFIALLELHSRGSARYQDLKELLVGLTRSLTAALDAKDSYTFGHSERVARIAVELGKELGLQGDELSDIYLAGLLHDVGKIGIRDSVLGKVEPLTAEEFEHIKQHVTIGYAILSDLRPIRNLLPGVLYHHEHWDGNGYPDGLAGDAIPLLARILAVADAYDAMSTNRPYRDALPCRKVEEILTKGAGTQWDKRVIEAFQRCRQKVHTIRQRGVGDSLQIAIDGALRIDKSSLHRKIEHLAD